MRKVQWGILSTANIGIKRVIPAILSGERGAVAAIASRDAARAAEAAARFAIPRSYGTYEELLRDPAIDAIYNPLPNHLHVEWTVRALNAGKHVLCEKPLGLNAPETQAIVDARNRSQKRVIEAFMVRHRTGISHRRRHVDHALHRCALSVRGFGRLGGAVRSTRDAHPARALPISILIVGNFDDAASGFGVIRILHHRHI